MKIYLIFILIIIVTLGLNTIAQKFLKEHWSLWLGYGVPALIMMLFLGRASRPPQNELFSDFISCYYPAGRLIIQNFSGLYALGSYDNIFGFVNIPILALLFTPFALLNRHTAIILFTLLGVLAVLATCYFLVRLTKVFGWKRRALIGLFVINGPLYHSLRYGNITHFVLLLLLVAWFCLEKQREFLLGVLLAIAALFKLPLFLLGVYFAVRKRWLAIGGFAVAVLVIVGASLLLFGIDLHLAWLHQIVQLSGKPVSAYNVQSLDGFLARLLLNTNEKLENWDPISVGWKFKLIRYTLLSLLVGTTIWVCWCSRPPTTLAQKNLEFSIVLCLALVISPISWTHYYLFLLLPFTLYLGNFLAFPKGRVWFTGMAATIFLTSMPVTVAEFTDPAMEFLYAKLLISHYFFGAVLLLGILLAARWHTAKRSWLSSG